MLALCQLYLGNKKSSSSISRVLYSAKKRNFYHLSGTDITDSLKQPTLRDRASSPLSPVYLVLQPIRFTPARSRLLTAWALTPRFHPYRFRGTGGNFLWHFLYPFRSFPFGSMVLCAALTFLFCLKSRNDKNQRPLMFSQK